MSSEAHGIPAQGGGPVRVLYFAGSGRSGSTVINNILGQVDGAFAAGELRYLWQRGVAENRLCGCGTPFADCALWRRVMDEVRAAVSPLDAAGVGSRLLSRLRMARVPAMLARRAVGQRAVPAHPDDVAVARLYAALAHVSGARVIVDSSKLPPYALLLSGLPGIELHVLQVVRDSRATAFSWRRRKQARDYEAGDGFMPQQPLWKSSLLWLCWNSLTVLLWHRERDRYLRLRYEDFVRAPRESMERVVQMVGLDPATLPFESPTSVRLEPTHSVAGNPSRHRVGSVELCPDHEWLQAMPRRQRVLVTTLTAPALRAFRYPLLPGGRP